MRAQELAERVLSSQGFDILERNKKIVIEGFEVGEVDLIVVDRVSGEEFAVEVKASSIDVSGVRQAYVNAMLLGMKPMVVARCFADEAAKVLAEKLGVKVILLNELFLVDPFELESIVEEAVEKALDTFLEIALSAHKLSEDELKILEAIATSETFVDAAKKVGVNVGRLASVLGKLREKIPLGVGKYSSIRLRAKLALLVARTLRRS